MPVRKKPNAISPRMIAKRILDFALSSISRIYNSSLAAVEYDGGTVII